ncbi:phosphoacetylglucosamine mutase PCM1 [Sugiyamaella lignohabitans]|uniref:Phosphoacetylglucosamine mutase n=1 Tax=Sugiyamaella lignohabitans TaxID=796027 RepID=A0A167FDD7_9ASCO|nr:phosphoacetylglucosamine mutase PCM1 [Sugiyamaella lignohabitans]ANB15155.1 phosphoacetylglucosamine mutase PCM1 [Sugiyamaella lignohabitans]
MAIPSIDISSADNYPKPDGIKFGYGTAGFRYNANILSSTVFRVGVLAALRSRYLGGKVIGVMITASHNPPPDNGAKIVDPAGDMLEEAWETYATDLANAATSQDLADRVNELIKNLNIDISTPANVIYARDSRESGPALVKALEAGLKAAHDAKSTDYGLLTTPQLHYLVKSLNTLKSANSYGVPTEEGYYKKLANAYKKVLSGSEPYSITIDAANGIGAPKVSELVKHLEGTIDMTLINGKYEDPSLLNSSCGADYVKTNQRLPGGLDADVPKLKLFCSFDGDADRIVFFYIDEDGKFRLLDGDKIATLAASFLKDLVQETNSGLNIGVVQTAYANGSSTEYLESVLKVPVVCTPTGVKHLHHAAQQFDIGVYFEANGHGTVLFHPDAVAKLQTFQVSSPAQKAAIDTLLALSDLVNQTVGDALSDLLLVLAILTIKRWNPADWNQSYTDLPNRLLKAEVRDRTMFKVTNAERTLVEPPLLQSQIDNLVQKYSQGRSFVRASGTENVVRIYAEAVTQTLADELGVKVSHLLEAYK